MRASLSALVSAEPALEVVAVASTAAEARAMVGQHPVDLALIDLSLPDGSGLDLAVELGGLDRRIATVIVSGHLSSHYRQLALRAGALAYLDKLDIPLHLIPILREILAL